ncbi:hypothetical protein O181_000785 [Austropuccinia psidii MF-1]|uniref:Integrase zinc-binding domain-containing protein n=1 Tax=Austropuccinia psidii MF-1 TaxID=1389203 RepID=A0A9Q3B9P5_9BASI|nr:hypothetical protein [Austropuccinia psidii MF-1]
MNIIRKIGHNDIVEITTPVIITWHDQEYRLCGDLEDLNNQTKADRYPIPKISHALDKLAKAKYINKMDYIKGFHHNGVKPNSIKLLRIICSMGIYEYTSLPFGMENASAHFQRLMDTIFQEEISEGWINPAYDSAAAANISIHLMEIYSKRNFQFSEWAPESGTYNSDNTEPEGKETYILGIRFSELHDEYFSSFTKAYSKNKQCSIMLQLLQQKYSSQELESQLQEAWLRDYKDNKFFLIYGLLYHREKHTSVLTVIGRDHMSLILKECHECPYMGHMSQERTKERVACTSWWLKWEQELSEYINTCQRFQNVNRKKGKRYGMLPHIEEPKHPWGTINMD